MSASPTALFLSKWARRYVSATVCYGFARATTYDYDSAKVYYNHITHTYEHKEMLLADQLGRVAFKSLAAVTVWPVMAGEDLARLECAVRKKDLREYGVRNSQTDS